MRAEILDLEKGGLRASDKIVGSGTGIYEVPRGEEEEKTMELGPRSQFCLCPWC